MKIRNLGKKSLKEVIDKVKDMGLTFKDEKKHTEDNYGIWKIRKRDNDTVRSMLSNMWEYF